MPDFRCTRHHRFAAASGITVLAGLCAISTLAAEPPGVTAAAVVGGACGCSDGRQFSPGASLFGKNSARVVITGFQPGPPLATGLPRCDRLAVLGQIVRLNVSGDRPFLKRENAKVGTIGNVCETKIQFFEFKKSYDFFADDGTAVTLSDAGSGSASPAAGAEARGDSDSSEDAAQTSGDLTGKELIRLIPRAQRAEEPGTAIFDADDLKEGSYIIVRRHLRAFPAVDDSGTTGAPAQARETDVWAGTLGRVQKRAGFRAEPLWVVEILPHSAPAPFSRALLSLPASFRQKRPPPKRFTLASSDIVEINHFFDQYGVEWTRFGEESTEARQREALGTTPLPELYAPPELSLDDNIDNARKAGAWELVRNAALRLVLIPKQATALTAREALVFENGAGPQLPLAPAPHYFRQQCFMGSKGSGSMKIPQGVSLAVTGVDIKIFQPGSSAQVPDDYYAVDLELQLRSDSGGAVPLVCRFPSAAIDRDLLDKAENILASRFEIRTREAR